MLEQLPTYKRGGDTLKNQAIKHFYTGQTPNNKLYLVPRKESAEEIQLMKMNHFMDKIGFAILRIVGLTLLGVVVIQLGIKFGW